jgi:hypothetical protein
VTGPGGRAILRATITEPGGAARTGHVAQPGTVPGLTTLLEDS